MKSVPKIGDYVRVWWYTGYVNKNNNPMSRIIKILPYRGPYEFIANIFTLSAPLNKSGELDMSITTSELMCWEPEEIYIDKGVR